MKKFKSTDDCNEKDEYIYFELNDDGGCINIFEESNEKINLNFSFIKDDVNFIIFKNKLNIFYTSLKEKINLYHSKIDEYVSFLNQVKNDEINYDLNSFGSKVDSILTEKFEVQLIKNCYNYYKNIVTERIENILDEFLNRLNNTYNNFKEEITNNIGNFIYDINEFYYIAAIYQNIINQNVTRKYFDSVIGTQQNEFNYTVSYYYDRFKNFINSTYKNIINNLDFNTNGFYINNNQIKELINGKFKEIFSKIDNSKKEYMSINRQSYTLSVPKTNFFKVNAILSNKVLESKNILESRYAEISSIDCDNRNTQESYISKLYLENGNHIFQIKDLFKTAFEKNFIELNPEKFKEVVLDNLKFDTSEFINRIKEHLNDIDVKESQNFINLKKQFTYKLEEEIKNYFSNAGKEGVLDKIYNLYNNEFKFNEVQIEEIYKNVNEILNRIVLYITSEKERILDKKISFKKDFSKINEKLEYYKNKIKAEIENNIKEVNNEYKENMINKVFTNKIENELNNYLLETQKQTNSFDDEIYSYNFKTIINTIIENLINKYKEKITNHIAYKSKMKLIDIINLEEINQIIKNKLDDEYNDFIFSLSASEGGSNSVYEFNSTITDDIENILNSKLQNITNIIFQLKDFYQINISEWPVLGLNNIGKTISSIKNDYDSFISEIIWNKESLFTDLLNNEIKNSFNNSLYHTISLFGKNFFDRYINYNELSKISLLFSNIKYINTGTLFYYNFLWAFNKKIYYLPNDLIAKFENFDINEIIQNQINEILNQLNEIINNFIETIKNNIIEKYISDIKQNDNLKSSFGEKISQTVENFLNSIDNKYFENIYYDILKKSLEKVNLNYCNMLNKTTNELKAINEQLKNEMIEELPKNTDDKNGKNEEMENINKLVNKIYELFKLDNKFKISEETSDNMSKKYKDILENLKIIINEIKQNKTNKIEEIKNDLINQLNQLKNFLPNQDIFNKMNTIKNNIINYINTINYIKSERKLDDNLINNGESQLSGNTNKSGIISSLINNNTRIYINSFTKLDKIINDVNYSFNKTLSSIQSGNYQKDLKDFASSQLLNISKEFFYYLENLKNFKNNMTNSFNETYSLLENAETIELNNLNNYLGSIKNKLAAQENITKEFNFNHTILSYLSYLINIEIKIENDIENDNFCDLNFNDDDLYNPKKFLKLKDKIKINMNTTITSSDKIIINFDSNNNNDFNMITYTFPDGLTPPISINPKNNKNSEINILNK